MLFSGWVDLLSTRSSIRGRTSSNRQNCQRNIVACQAGGEGYMRTVGVVTVARSDFGLLRPALQEMDRRPTLRARLFVAGAHLSPAHGLTVREIREEGWPIALEVQTVTEDTPHGIAVSMGAALMGFGSGWNAHRPDAILALGDRFETFCAVAAAAPFRIPVFHLHGGEATEGLYDEAFRHAITKMSHVHLVANGWAAGRVRALGEEAWRVRVVGAPGLDGIAEFKPIPRAEAAFLPGAGKFLLVVWHPETLRSDPVDSVFPLVGALRQIGMPYLWIGPGADVTWSQVGDIPVVKLPDGGVFHAHLPRPQFWTAMAHAEALVGNSSAGIIEAASFGLPVVNVGDRQKGRLHLGSVINVPPDAEAIAGAIQRATDPDLRRQFDAALGGGTRRWVNPYGDGHASQRIADILEAEELGERLLMKRLEA